MAGFGLSPPSQGPSLALSSPLPSLAHGWLWALAAVSGPIAGSRPSLTFGSPSPFPDVTSSLEPHRWLRTPIATPGPIAGPWVPHRRARILIVESWLPPPGHSVSLGPHSVLFSPDPGLFGPYCLFVVARGGSGVARSGLSFPRARAGVFVVLPPGSSVVAGCLALRSYGSLRDRAAYLAGSHRYQRDLSGVSCQLVGRCAVSVRVRAGLRRSAYNPPFLVAPWPLAYFSGLSPSWRWFALV